MSSFEESYSSSSGSPAFHHQPPSSQTSDHAPGSLPSQNIPLSTTSGPLNPQSLDPPDDLLSAGTSWFSERRGGGNGRPGSGGNWRSNNQSYYGGLPSSGRGNRNIRGRGSHGNYSRGK